MAAFDISTLFPMSPAEGPPLPKTLGIYWPWHKAPTPGKYTLTITVLPANAGSVSPSSGEFTAGQAVTLTATPASGYTFDRWSGDASGSSPTTTITMNANKSVVANFVTTAPPPTGGLTLTLAVTPAGSGTVSRSPVKATYSAGDTIVLTATPATGYTFSKWSGGIADTANPVTIKISANATITANFVTTAPPPTGGFTLTLAAVPENGGNLFRDPWGTGPNYNQYAAGAIVKLTAQPLSGYQFSYWDCDGQWLDTANPINFMVMASHTVTAHFTPVTTAPPVTAGLKYAIGDIIGIGDDIYTVHGADTTARQYLLYTGRYPNDTPSYNWVGSDYIDSVSYLIDHVNIVYAE